MKDKLGDIVRMSIKIHGDEPETLVDTFNNIKERIVKDVNEANIFYTMLYPDDIKFVPLDKKEHFYKIVVCVPYYINFKTGEKNGDNKSK